MMMVLLMTVGFRFIVEVYGMSKFDVGTCGSWLANVRLVRRDPELCPHPNFDYSGMDFTFTNFDDYDFRACNMSSLNAGGASFHCCDMRGCNFRGAHFAPSDFSGADLRGADFSGADLRNCDFSWAYLDGANFDGANVAGCCWENAIVENANFDGAIGLGEGFCVMPNVRLVSDLLDD